MKQTYETAVKELENTVNSLEKGGLNLDETLKLYEQGIKLSKFCVECLDKAEQKILMLSDVEGGNNE